MIAVSRTCVLAVFCIDICRMSTVLTACKVANHASRILYARPLVPPKSYVNSIPTLLLAHGAALSLALKHQWSTEEKGTRDLPQTPVVS
jgi:hypothetical protein